MLHLLNRIKCYLFIANRKLFFNAYILPHIDYCCTVWGNTNSNLTNSMIQFQKKAARIILDKNIDSPSSELFAELNWLTFPDIVDYQKAVLMYKIMNNLTPNYLNELYQFTSDIHQRSLRSTQKTYFTYLNPTSNFFENLWSLRHKSISIFSTCRHLAEFRTNTFSVMLTLHVIWVKTGLKPTFTKQNNIIALCQNMNKERGIISVDRWIKDARLSR